MKIYIPTRGRVNQQVTYRQLPASLQAQTILVVDASEANLHTGYTNLMVCPASVNSIGKVRQFICEKHLKYNPQQPELLMLDDDLRFSVRREDDVEKFRNSTPADIAQCVKFLERTMKNYMHGGILAREGAQHRQFTQGPIHECTRLLRALAYNAATLHKHKVRFDRLIVMEDFDVALQLLRLGYKSAAVCGWVQNQQQSNAPGGCSIYRTLARQEEGARGLAKLHAPFVKAVQKTTKTAWNGQTRTDVIVYWKRALAGGL